MRQVLTARCLGAACLALLVIPNAYGQAAMVNPTPGAPTNAHCSLAVSRIDGGVSLDGMVPAGGDRSGEYRLLVEKTGPGGRSNIVQAGAYRSEPSQAVRVAQVTLGLEPGSRYTATLTLVEGDQTFTCRAVGPDDR